MKIGSLQINTERNAALLLLQHGRDTQTQWRVCIAKHSIALLIKNQSIKAKCNDEARV